VNRDYTETFNRSEAAARTEPAAATDGAPRRITRSAEELRIGKRNVSAGEVSVRKHVTTEHVSQPVTRSREVVHVDRRPVSGDSAGVAEIRDGEIRVPLVEEEVVVEKRPMLKEEIVITKERVSETENVEADVREEQIEIDGVDETTDRGSAERRGR
jgi:uncharacterized protein (TIGR02271 family)